MIAAYENVLDRAMNIADREIHTGLQYSNVLPAVEKEWFAHAVASILSNIGNRFPAAQFFPPALLRGVEVIAREHGIQSLEFLSVYRDPVHRAAMAAMTVVIIVSLDCFGGLSVVADGAMAAAQRKLSKSS